MRGIEIRVRGTVQGVGFRPFVWRLARELGLRGEVLNDAAGADSRIVGEVIPGPRRRVTLRTAFGSERVVDMLVGEQLPRIC